MPWGTPGLRDTSRAFRAKRALDATGPARETEAPPVFDQQHVEPVVVGGLNQCREGGVRLFRCELGGNETETLGTAFDVCVHRHRG